MEIQYIQENEEAPEFLKCPITRVLIQDPVIASDGYTYERMAIEKWFKGQSISPVTAENLNNKTLYTNKVIKGLIETFLDNKLRTLKHKFELIKTNKILKSNTEIQSKIVSNEDETLSKELAKNAVSNYYQSSLPVKECIEIMEKAYSLNPNNAEILSDLINMQRYASSYNCAYKNLKILKLISNFYFISKFMKIRILHESNNHSDAIKKFEKVVMSSTISNYSLIEIRYLSFCYLKIESFLVTERLINSYISLVPNDSRALSQRINLNYLQDRNSEVVEDCNLYYTKYGVEITVLSDWAIALSNLKRNKESIECYYRIINVSTEKYIKAKSLISCAHLRSIETEFLQIEDELIKANEIDDSQGSDFLLIKLYVVKKLYEKALEWMQILGKRINISETNAALIYRAKIYRKLFRYEDAVMDYIRLTEIDEGNVNRYNNKINKIYATIESLSSISNEKHEDKKEEINKNEDSESQSMEIEKQEDQNEGNIKQISNQNQNEEKIDNPALNSSISSNN